MIVAGFGMTSRATVQSLEEALAATGYIGKLDLIAMPNDKAAQPAALDFARAQCLSISVIQPYQLHEARTHTQSFMSRLFRKTGSVAEASALAGAGPNATLIVTRQVSEDSMATCAIAQRIDA